MTLENQELLQAIGQMMDEKLDARFAEYDKKTDEKLDARFAEYDKKMDEKLDARFAEYDKKMEARFEKFKAELLDAARVQTNILLENQFQRHFNLLSEKIDQSLENVAPMEAILEHSDRLDHDVAPMEAVLELSERLDHVESTAVDLTRRVEALEQCG